MTREDLHYSLSVFKFTYCFPYIPDIIQTGSNKLIVAQCSLGFLLLSPINPTRSFLQL